MSDRNSFDELRINMMNLYEEGKYAAALELVEKNEPKFPDQSARTAFWKMCLLSLDGRLEEAISTFRRGLDDGMWWHESQFIDTDLDPLRDLSEFKELVARSVQAWEQGRKQIERDHLLLLPDAPPSRPYPLMIVLHGRHGDKETNLEQWEVARRLGWAILSAQSTQPLYRGAYHWDDPVTGVQDILFYLEHTLKANPIDRERIVIGGFSQGSGMAIYAALSGSLPVRGFIAGATWWPDVESLAALASHTKNLRGYFVCGEMDYTLDRAREIQVVLQQHKIPYTEEFHPGLGHEFPPDFETSFKSALEFIFKE
jgi:predicted esterase